MVSDPIKVRSCCATPDRTKDFIVTRPHPVAQCLGPVGGVNRGGGALLADPQRDAALVHRRQLGTARDRRDLDVGRRPMRGEARREVPADGPGAEDYDAHRPPLTAYPGRRAGHTALRYFAAAGNAGSLPMSRMSSG
jgi:hypothetical protein